MLRISQFKKFANTPQFYTPKTITAEDAEAWGQKNQDLVRSFKQNVDELALENFNTNFASDGNVFEVDPKKDNWLKRFGKGVVNTGWQTAGMLGNASRAAYQGVRNALGVGTHSKVQRMLQQHPELAYYASGLNQYKGYYDRDLMAQNAARDAANLQNETYSKGVKGAIGGVALAATGGTGGFFARGATSLASRAGAGMLGRVAPRLLGNTAGNFVNRAAGGTTKFMGGMGDDIVHYYLNPLALLKSPVDVFRKGQSIGSRAWNAVLTGSMFGGDMFATAPTQTYKNDMNYRNFLAYNPDVKRYTQDWLFGDDNSKAIYDSMLDQGFQQYLNENPQLVSQIEQAPKDQQQSVYTKLFDEWSRTQGFTPNFQMNAMGYDDIGRQAKQYLQ